ncbi:cation:proton antiporter [Actinomyces trachealis]|uniref:cation:proton antiporter n=1 Tax=Actinomyces trachealis TaxID=2763540 RepID=UPI001892C2F6|nr:cation:proton antiporter [Actinomyces trachealis]
MESTLVSLLCIVGVAFLAPLISWLVPKRLLPEVVLLTIGGMLIGEHALGLATQTDSIAFLHELGLAFLFLMAGYEIDINELRGVGGHHAMGAWVLSLLTAFGAIALLSPQGGPFSTNGIAIAIAMTSTAVGTLLPIMRERNLLPTSVGAAILNHGAVGEVGPVILMALLLGSRSTWASLVILLLFGAVTLLIVRFTDRVKQVGHRLVEAIHLGGSTTAQTTVRLTVLLLVGLCTLADVFKLDVVLGAFAAGFVVRHALPDGNKEYEEKIEGLAYGLFIPLFFVTSGMGIAVDLTQRSLIGLGVFLLLLVLARGLPVWLASRFERRHDGSRAFTNRECLEIATYSTTALPIIVAVTQVAVDAGAMVEEAAATFVLAGLLSVIVMPALGLFFSEAREDVAEPAAVEETGAVGETMLEPGLDTEPTAGTGVGAGQGSFGGDSVENDGGPFTDRRQLPDGNDVVGGWTGVASAGRDADRGSGPAGGGTDLREQLPRRAQWAQQRLDLLSRHGLSPEEARILAARLAQIQVERVMWRDQFGAQLRSGRRGRGGRSRRRR